jgi:hypothetical protein
VHEPVRGARKLVGRLLLERLLQIALHGRVGATGRCAHLWHVRNHGARHHIGRHRIAGSVPQAVRQKRIPTSANRTSAASGEQSCALVRAMETIAMRSLRDTLRTAFDEPFQRPSSGRQHVADTRFRQPLPQTRGSSTVRGGARIPSPPSGPSGLAASLLHETVRLSPSPGSKALAGHKVEGRYTLHATLEDRPRRRHDAQSAPRRRPHARGEIRCRCDRAAPAPCYHCSF